MTTIDNVPIKIASAASQAASEVQGMGALHVGVHVVQQLLDKGMITLAEPPQAVTLNSPGPAQLNLFSSSIDWSSNIGPGWVRDNFGRFHSPTEMWDFCQCEQDGSNNWWKCPQHGSNA